MKATWLLVIALPIMVALIREPLESKNDPLLLGIGQMPAVAVDEKKVIHIVYGIGDSLMYRHSLPDGQHFSEPELISVVNDLFAFATRGPRIVSMAEEVCVVAPTEGGDIYSFTKKADNKWQRGSRITDVDSVNREGFVALTSDGKTDLFAAWLDLRGNQRNKIYGARSTDAGKTWQRNIEVYSSPDSTVCECCQVSAAMYGDSVYVMFRNWLNGNRDLHIAKSSDGGKSFKNVQKLGFGSWQLNGCPMDGGSLVINKSGVPQTVWRREASVYACEAGKPEVAIGEGRSPAIDVLNQTPIYTWVEKGKVVCRLAAGTKRYLGNGANPLIKAVDNERVFCIWENDGKLYCSFVNS